MSDKNFILGNMCDELVDMSLDMCGKSTDNNPRFPRWSYDTYVERIMRMALDIQELIITCNEYRKGDNRKIAQIKAMGKCTYLNHLIRIAWNRGYISQKQHDRWSKLTTSIKWKIKRWCDSENK